MTPAIRIENLGKRYLVNHAVQRAPYRTLRDSLVSAATAPLRRIRSGGQDGTVEDFWALKDVSFDVQPGEVVGIIGRNGAGKSTLLKILSRITKPTTGRVTLRGRVGSLLEVGTGFHPELTGRENVYLNGGILGMSRKEIDRNFDAIVDFSGVEKFLDTPVKRYSSGMQVRLAFAVAAHLEPEILIVDEVLAVGDVEFQRKCLGKMREVSTGGRTVLFVSHNMAALRSITESCVLLQNGQVVCRGLTTDVIDRYLGDSWSSAEVNGDLDLSFYRRDKRRSSPVRIDRLWFTTTDGRSVKELTSGDDFVVHCDFTSTESYQEACVAFSVTNQQGDRVATFFSLDAGARIDITPGTLSFACRVIGLPLSPGRYSITLGINEHPHTVAFDVIVDLPAFHVVMPQVDNGTMHWSHRPWGAVHWYDVLWTGAMVTPSP